MKKLLLSVSVLFFICLQLSIASTIKKPADGINEKQTDTLIKNVTVVQADSLIQSNTTNPDFIIIDVRTPSEYGNGFIQGAININYYAANFGAIIDTLDKNKMYLVYCGSGTRSAKARDTMQRKHFVTVYNMLGGTGAWVGAGYPLVTATSILALNNTEITTSVYPNPVSDVSTIDISGIENFIGVVMIYDLFGKEIKRLKITNKINVIQNEFDDGIYFYQVIANDKLIGSGKFEVIK
jgi:rhodanese-related sulfurtransferase